MAAGHHSGSIGLLIAAQFYQARFHPQQDRCAEVVERGATHRIDNCDRVVDRGCIPGYPGLAVAGRARLVIIRIHILVFDKALQNNRPVSTPALQVPGQSFAKSADNYGNATPKDHRMPPTIPTSAGLRPVTVVPLYASESDDALQARISHGMTYEVAIDSFFGASHAMRPTGERHTHSFRVQAAFVTDHVDDNGMTVGFREVSDLLNREARKYANQFLNDIEPFIQIQATGENLAAVIFHNIHSAVTATIPDGPKLIAVTLWENPTSYIRVERAKNSAS